MKDDPPVPVRFTAALGKRIRVYAIQTDKTFSAAVRDLCGRGLASLQAEVERPQPHSPARRVLSRGVTP